VSEFDTMVDWLKEQHSNNFDACANKAVKQWSTTKYSSYEEMMTELGDTKEINQELSKLYRDSRTDKKARNWAKSSGLELQLQFMNGIKAAIHRKFVQTEEDKDLTSAAHIRYAANERREAEKILERFQQWVNSRIE